MEQIKFILERFFYGWKMNVLVYDKDDQLVDFCVGTKEKVSSEYMAFFQELHRKDTFAKEIYETLKEKCRCADMPVIYMEEEGIYYLSFLDSEENLFLFGPASVETLSFVQQMSYRKRHHIKKQEYLVPKVSFSKSLNGVSLVYYILTGRQVTEDAIMKVSEVEADVNVAPVDMMAYEIENTTKEKQHLAYQDELRWTMAIENGVLENKDKRMTPENLENLEKIGTLANADSRKQIEYMAVTSSCLASRAAIRGGVNAYDAYRMSEMFLQKISKCTNVMEILKIHMEISETFTEMVCKVKENRNSDCVEQCKDYIARYRTKKFSLNDVAEAVGKNPSYLSRVFSEQTGMSMQEYALNIRLEAAANILRYSNESVGGIAQYLDFPSQSYFGEKFKKKYGMTPAEYRRRNKIRDFKE